MEEHEVIKIIAESEDGEKVDKVRITFTADFPKEYLMHQLNEAKLYIQENYERFQKIPRIL